MSGLVYACDCSNHQGTISPERAACLKSKFGAVVIRLSTERQALIDIAREQIQACQAAGLLVLGYPWAYFNMDWRQQVDAVLNAYHDLSPHAIFMDCEDEQNVLSPAQNVVWLQAALGAYAAAGYPTGIYSGPWYWSRYLGGDQSFGAYVSWVANPNGRAALDDVRPLGGAPVVGKQYAWDANLCGIAPLDLDVFDGDWISSISGGLSMSDQEDLAYLRSWYGLVKDDYMNNIQGHLDTLKKGLYKEQKPDFAAIQSVVNTIKRG